MAVAHFAGSAFALQQCWVPLRFTPGSMLAPATRVLENATAVTSYRLWSAVSKGNHRLKSVPHQGLVLPKKKSIQKTVENLRDEIQRHEDLYYLHDNPEISDREYDALIENLRQLEEKNPEFISPDSPTQRVGGKPAEAFPEFLHRRPMLSLDNSYNIDELRAYDERCRKLADGAALEYVAELKIDGLSLSSHYQDGLFVRGVTRADGQRGQDVTANVRTIRSVPLRLRAKSSPGPEIEVRGEAYLSRKVFERINAEREEDVEPRFANPRNAAAGAIRQLDPVMVQKRRLEMFAYDMLAGDRKAFATHWEALN